MKIDWRLYDETGADPGEPLGAIALTDDEGNRIEQEATYLDTWFRALLAGLQSLAAGAETLEQVEGPDPLEFVLRADRVFITYGLDAIDAGALQDCAAAARAEARRFLAAMQAHGGWKANDALRSIQLRLES